MAQKNYDSEFCGNLPLHHINLIQDYGYLLVLNKDNFTIIQASENIAEIAGKPVQELIDTALEEHTAQGDADKLRKQFEAPIPGKIPFTTTINGVQLHTLAHIKGDCLVLELEKADTSGGRYFTDVFQEIKYAMAAIELANSIEEVSATAIHQLKELSGFDGVMMYRFDKDWNGTVIAEEKTGELESYMGFTFPASDIPKQARQMYLKNPYRLIPNRDYKPVRLYPVINPATQTFIDLSECNLRSVVAVHLEYLKNMNVSASMSIRVIHNERLWGLIACHHITPKYLNFEICSVFELLSSVVSNKISAILNKENFDFAGRLQQQRTSLVEQIYAAGELIAGLTNEEGVSLQEIFSAGGMVIRLEGRTEVSGKVPDNDAIENLVLWLQGKNESKVFTSDHLSGIYDEAEEYADIASGILVIPLDNDKGDYIICFRPEVIETIKWGGNPDQAINFTNDGKNYHPRNSFKLWQQTVRYTSKPWQQPEMEAAEALRSFIYEFRTRQMHA